MTIRKLTITDVRNVRSASLEPSADVNVFYGQNGSGKTSLLEAIHILGVARSFRTPKVKPVIRAGAEKMTVFGLIDPSNGKQSLPVGVSKGLLDDNTLIRVAGETLYSSSELASLLPLLVINPDTFKLLEGSPGIRRNFIDWGVFHVKHDTFLPAWKSMQKALKQRNALLRQGRVSESELLVWNHEFVNAAEQVDILRKAHIEQLLPYFYNILKRFFER